MEDNYPNIIFVEDDYGNIMSVDVGED